MPKIADSLTQVPSWYMLTAVGDSQGFMAAASMKGAANIEVSVRLSAGLDSFKFLVSREERYEQSAVGYFS